MPMKRCIMILLLSAIVVLTGSCDEFVPYVWTGPQSNLTVPARSGILFPELCYVSYGGKTYSYGEDRFNDSYGITKIFDLGVTCYTHLPDDSSMIAEDYGMLELGIRAEDMNLDENYAPYPGEYTAQLILDVYELQDGKMKRQSNSVSYAPCTLVIDEVSTAERPRGSLYPFDWQVKAHITEEDINGSPVQIEINMKFF